MKGVRRFQDRLKADLKDPKVREAFEREEIFAALAIQIAMIRQDQGLSQADLAQRLHTTQQTVSRLENMDNQSCSVGTLIKIAGALRRKLKIEFV